jgi:hypothetical protein
MDIMSPQYCSYKSVRATRNGEIKKMFGKQLWMNSLDLHGYHQKGIINLNELSMDSTIPANKEGEKR